MDFFEGRNFVINKRLLFYIGLWPHQTRPERIFFRSITIFLFVSLVVPKLIRLWEVLGNFRAVVDCIPVLCVDFLGAVKYLTWAIKHKQMRTLMSKIEEDWNGNIEDHEILTRYAERSRLLTIGYAFYLGGTFLCYLLMPMVPIILDVFVPQNVSRDRIISFQVEYFIDMDKYYFWILIHAYVASSIPVISTIAFDTTFAVQVHHACGVFASVGERLRKICCRDDKKMEKHEKFAGGGDEAYKNIVACLKIHKHAVEFSTLLESLNSLTFIFVIGVAILALTLIGYMTVTNLGNHEDSIRYGTFVSGEIIHIWYLSWQGQQLLDHSINILYDAYDVDFVNISISAKRLLILMMLRSLKPCTVTAGKIYILSMESFAVALKTSMSYFTVLLSMQ